MSRGTKSKSVSGEKGSSPQDESRFGEMKIADLFRMLNSRFDEQEKRSEERDSRFEALQEDLKNTNQCLEELQLRVPRPRLADVGIQEGKSGEFEGIATEAGERKTTPPEPQRQQPLLPSQPPRLPPQPPMMPQTSMSQPPPPPSQPPPLQYYQSPLHQSRHLPSSPFSAGRQQLHSTPSMIGTSNHRSPAGAGARGAVPAGESPAGIPWKLNPPFFSGDSVHFCSFKKEAIIFAQYVGFGHVLKDTREIPVADPSISYAQLRSLGYTDDEIDAHRRPYQFLRSAITSEVDRGILHRAHSPTEAWRSLKKWHNPDTVSATQTLHQRFLSYTMRPGQNLVVIPTALEEMAAQLSQQNFPMASDQALLQFLTILPDSEYEVEKRTCSTGQRLDLDQVLLTIRTRYDNLQRQRNKGGGRRDAGHAFIADTGSSGKPGGRSTPRGARNRGGRGRGGRGGRDGNGGEKGVEKKDGQTTNINASDGNVDGGKGGNARCNRCGEAGHKTVRCPEQVCSVCGGKGHSAKICANVVTVFACEADGSGSDSDGVLSGEKQDAFVCDALGKFFDEPDK